MEIIADNQVAVGHGFYEEGKSSLVIDFTDEQTGAPVRVFLYPDTAREIIRDGLSKWLTPAERKDIIRNFIR